MWLLLLDTGPFGRGRQFGDAEIKPVASFPWTFAFCSPSMLCQSGNITVDTLGPRRLIVRGVWWALGRTELKYLRSKGLKFSRPGDLQRSALPPAAIGKATPVLVDTCVKWLLLIVNLIGCRVVIETPLWVCLWGCLQKGVTEEDPSWMWVASLQGLVSGLRDCECNVTSYLTLLLPHCPQHGRPRPQNMKQNNL